MGTGKYLSVADDKFEIELKNNSSSYNSLFVLKSDMTNKSNTKYEESIEHGEIDKTKLL